MLAKTRAVALRISPFSQTSHVVSWLSPDWGRLSTVIKGACRRNSRFLGEYDLGATTELVFYRREREGLHVARECSLETARGYLRNDWRAYAAASWGLELAARSGTGPDEAGRVFALLEAFLDGLAGSPAAWRLLGFEMDLMGALGFRPVLDRCARCGAGFVRGTPVAFSAAHGGTVCAQDEHAPIAPDVLALLRRLAAGRRQDDGRSLRGLTASTDQLLACARVVGTLLSHHLEVSPEPRDLAYGLLAGKRKPTQRR